MMHIFLDSVRLPKDIIIPYVYCELTPINLLRAQSDRECEANCIAFLVEALFVCF